mmetsp:Transcript_24053/g.74749  ORF Transcript_24053/g.74749 Transcript_24053/m.74749 type:complete len:976 (+) Transcript_24053:301-3228(+)
MAKSLLDVHCGLRSLEGSPTPRTEGARKAEGSTSVECGSLAPRAGRALAHARLPWTWAREGERQPPPAPGLGLEELGPVLALDGHPADDAVLLGADLHSRLLPLLLNGALQQLDDLACCDLADQRGTLGRLGVVEGCRLQAVEVRGPRLHVVTLQRDPADNAIAQRLALDTDRRHSRLLLGPIEDLQRLTLLECSNRGGIRAQELLLQLHFVGDRVMLRARLRVDRPCIALDRNPSLLVVLHGLALHSRDAGLVVAGGALDNSEDLTLGELSHDVAVLDVALIRHRHRCDAGIVLAVWLRKGRALRVLDREPAGDAIADSLGAHADDRRLGPLPGPLDKLDHLICLQSADVVVLVALEGGLHDHFPSARVVRLLHLLQERRALVAVHRDPALLAVDHGLAPHARQPRLLVCAWALQHLDHLLHVCFSDGLGFADWELISDCNGLDDNEILLQKGQELPPANATHLDVLAQELGVLRGKGDALQRVQVPAEGIFRDPVLAPLQELLEEVLGADAPGLRLRAEGRGGLGVPGVHDALAGGQGGLHGLGALALHRDGLALHLRQLLLGLKHGPLGRLADLGQLLLDARPRSRNALGGLGLELLRLLQHRGWGRERVQLGPLDRDEGLHHFLEGLQVGLHRAHLGNGVGEDRLRRLPLARLDVRVLLRGLLLGELHLGGCDLLLQGLEGRLHRRDLRPRLRQLRPGVRQRSLGPGLRELRALHLEEVRDRGDALVWLRQRLLHCTGEGGERRDGLQVLRPLVPKHRHKAGLPVGDELALQARHAVRVVLGGIAQGLHNGAGIHLALGLALGNLEDVRERDALLADELLLERLLEVLEADGAVLVDVHVLEDGGPALLRESDLLVLRDCWQLLEVCAERLLRDLSVGAPLAHLREQGLLAQLVLRHVVPQHRGQRHHAVGHQELRAATLEERGAGGAGGLEVGLHLLHEVGHLGKELLGGELLLVVADDLLRLCKLDHRL